MRRLARFCLIAPASAVLALACGGSIEPDFTESTDKKDGSTRDGTSLIDGGKKDGTIVPLKDGSVGKDANNFVDPKCPNTPPPNTAYECDVAKQKGCKAGEACSPFVDYPTDPCDPETYGSLCIPAGTGTQGSACDGQRACAAGYICVITGAGTNCAKYCDLNNPSGCTDGLICDAVDVSGVGVCN